MIASLDADNIRSWGQQERGCGESFSANRANSEGIVRTPPYVVSGHEAAGVLVAESFGLLPGLP